ncbi:glycosyltransferase [Candidatus Saccharibacteria bacterium]|nr:glycosyltransferase [Candidatus Saccharibacteria bacterium]
MAKAHRLSKRPKVSIVVPIYKVERYLRECVDSILRQTLKDIEIILVDDGSPDNCGKIIDEYARKDKRIVAVHQKNSGYSKAVNRGIDMARGEYIGIIESDDWIDDDMYETLYRNAKKYKTDVSKGMFYIYRSTAESAAQNVVYRNPNGVDLRLAPDGVFKPTDWPKIMAFHASLWSSIYKASFIKKIKLPETAGASYQDFPFITEVFCKAKKISVVKRPFVHWRNDDDQGNSTSAKGEKLLFMAKNSKTALKILKNSKKYEDFKEAFFVHVFWANYGFFNRIDLRYKKTYFNELSDIFKEIKDDPNFHFSLFTKYEKNKIKFFLTKGGYRKFLLKEFVHSVKITLIKIATFILPTYRMARFLKDQNWDILHQNELLMEEILELHREIEKLKKSH